MSIPRRWRAALALSLAALATQAQALQLVGVQAAGNDASVTLNGSSLALDLTLRNSAPVRVELALEAADVGQWLAFNAVVGAAAGAALPGLQLSLQGASFGLVGSVTPAFGQLASISGDDLRQTLQFNPAETYAVDLGAPFGQAGTQDWLLAPTGLQAGDRLALTISAVPEPTTTAMLGLGLAALLVAARRRG
ncbi:PEP-CTERM sorting domain-containing protein [Aquincola tertiaricarbonis]|uniref:PEP-CTERM sorting domain-containing protein n=1 Tax=Aquincola tertiaricarbonis TaxID=391953 RepID=A0ABY4S7B7_AQUTE|nr:PEP-CTERM sorting domain-containing protein [Aquincola tertiaricarbonis]URI06981.1 PEP-CTERM sorting domain-containing protein [Aquincola tertiaricarbonis]